MPSPARRWPWQRRPRRTAPDTGDRRAAGVTEEQAALGWLCVNLPDLRQKADRFGWRADLDRELSEVRAGKAATEALRELRLRREGSRASGLPADETWQERPVIERFRCPHGRCPARGRNADATEPRCHLDGTPMLAEDGG
ncbi:hypothetical protein AB0K23_25105 [Streptomyces sp. NPDC049602]|uniref:hypothetical protein n=1 Tax=Streptomyces sp. NPDC049602 TaxID=3155504 RepID=UPI003420C122